MIMNKNDLKEYMKSDMSFYYQQSKRERFMYWLTNDPIYSIAKYIRLLRKEEYYANTGRRKIDTLLCLYYLNRKNTLGNKLGFIIPRNCFGPGLVIYHHGEITVNGSARIGSNCKLHGANCIGNNGQTKSVPNIGDDLDLGIGARIIGNVKLGNGIVVGANAVVTKSHYKDNIKLIGVPAKELIVKENNYECSD